MLAAATFAQATASFVMLGLSVLAGFLQQDFRLTTAEVGLLIAASGAASVMALPIVGGLLDRQSECLIIAIGAALVAFALIFAALGSDFAIVLLCLFVVGIGYSATQPGGSKSVSAWFRRRQLGLAMGIWQAGLPLGGGAAAAILPSIASSWNWRVAFAIGAAVALSGGLAFSAFYRSPAGAQDKIAPQRSALSLPQLFAMLRQPWMRSVVLAGASLVSAQYALLLYFMLFLRDGQSTPLTQGGWLMFITQLCGVSGRCSWRPGATDPRCRGFAWYARARSQSAQGCLSFRCCPLIRR